MSATPTPQQNHLLAALSTDVQERIFPFLEPAPMPLGKVLFESGALERHVYFPTDSIISLLYVMENGASAEISVVGNEGLVGIALFMGGESTTSRAIVQSAGFAYRLLGKRFKDEVSRHGDLLFLMLRYSQALITQMAQTAVCNRHHSIEQQLCRWLLLSIDRLPASQLIMTQELIANMLGVRREGITVSDFGRVDWDQVNLDEWLAILAETGLYPTLEDLGLEALTGSGGEYAVSGERADAAARSQTRSDGVDSDAARREAEMELWGETLPALP
jgi:CRP-like cAMP-binding protein